MKNIIFSAAITFWAAISAVADDNIEIAERFMNALETGDLETVAALAHDDIRFEDPTWGAEHQGRDKVLKTYENYTGSMRNLRRLVVRAYESNNTVVLELVIYAEVDVLGNGDPDSFTPIMGNTIRIFGFKDGKVVRHTDLADYGVIMRTINEAAARKRAQN